MPTNNRALSVLWSLEKPSDFGNGRYPFATWVNKYLQAMVGSLAQSTLENRRRLYKRMFRELRDMEDRGLIGTTNPLKLSVDDIGTIVTYYKTRGWKTTSVELEFTALNNLLLYVGNPAFVAFKIKNPSMFPSVVRPRYPSAERAFFEAILEKAQSIEDCDWKRMRAYALVLFAFATGARNKEMRLATAADLRLDEGIFHAEHVKGEGKWGEPRDIPIRPEVTDFLGRYLLLRAKMLKANGYRSEALFPPLSDESSEGFLSSNSMRRIKTIVEKEMGRSFDFRTCRRSYGQYLLDENNSIETVSVTMGHKTSVTTECYYARRKQAAAIAEARRNWQPQRLNKGRRSINYRERYTG